MGNGKFKPTTGGKISKSEFTEEREKFQKKNKGQTKSVFFGRDVIEMVLAQKGAAGLRFYFVENKKGKMDLVFEANDEDGRPVGVSGADDGISLKSASTDGGPDEGMIINRSIQCPPDCPPDNG